MKLKTISLMIETTEKSSFDLAKIYKQIEALNIAFLSNCRKASINPQILELFADKWICSFFINPHRANLLFVTKCSKFNHNIDNHKVRFLRHSDSLRSPLSIHTKIITIRQDDIYIWRHKILGSENCDFCHRRGFIPTLFH